jgi:proline dehydrogenase
VQLLIDAEQVALQGGIDDWGLAYMRKYNRTRATVFGTYQAYLKKCPAVLRAHVEAAQRDGFVVGVKLVRGAYLATEERGLIHDTKADTDRCFDALAASVLRREWSEELPGEGAFPEAALIVATHNAASVERARLLVEAGEARTAVAFAQLQGMADEVSFSLVGAKGLGAYKYFAWGSTADCIKYLVRRAEENRDAVQRTRDSRNAMWGELVRRVRGVVGL